MSLSAAGDLEFCKVEIKTNLIKIQGLEHQLPNFEDSGGSYIR